MNFRRGHNPRGGMYNRPAICGMPNRNGGSSTSDTGSAVIM